MSARDKLRSCFPVLPEGESNDLIEQAVDEILADHAHELAEKIRAEIQSIKADGVLELDRDWAASDAADLIDSKISKPVSEDGGLTAEELAKLPDGTVRCLCTHWDTVHGTFCFVAGCGCVAFTFENGRVAR